MGHTAISRARYCMSALSSALQHVSVRELPHIKKLDDCFGDFECQRRKEAAKKAIPKCSSARLCRTDRAVDSHSKPELGARVVPSR